MARTVPIVYGPISGGHSMAGMPAVSLVDATTDPGSAAVVVGVLSGSDGPRLAPGGEPVDAALSGRLLSALRSLGASGRADEVFTVPTLGLASFPLVVATGLGPDGDGGLDAEQVRRAVGAAVRALNGARPRRIHLAIGDTATSDAAGLGALLGAYSYSEYRSDQRPPNLRRVTVGVADPKDAAARASLRQAAVIADAVTLTRDLVNAPPNHLYPETFAARAADVGRDAGLEVEILDVRALRRGRYGGILAVGNGSARPPRLIRLRYRPARARARIAFVGKGITFDSGGLNLKPGNSMSTMKCDMGGAAACVAASAAIARLRLPVEVVATVPMAENMPSGTGYRPSDVVTLRGGRTIEIANTDAEGRVVLADGIVRAAEDDPDRLIEVSTLTGGQVVALGTRVIGAMGEPDFRDLVVAAGNDAGEALWAMPLPDELRGGLDSPVADLSTLPGDSFASMLIGGVFLREFVPEGLPWVHLDIAGPAYNTGSPYGYTPKGATGSAVRTLIASARAVAA
jgi:leucyl aminopeptidase